MYNIVSFYLQRIEKELFSILTLVDGNHYLIKIYKYILNSFVLQYTSYIFIVIYLILPCGNLGFFLSLI